MISYVEDSKKFNFRVGGIITDQNQKKILLHRLSNFDFWLLPGGRVEMLEGTEDAIKREIKEELGINASTDRLVAITESFFDMRNITYHEIAFNYLMKIPENSRILQMNGEFAGIEGEKYRYRWFDRENLRQLPIRPNYILPALQELPKELVHIIKDERVKEKEDGCER